MNWKRLEHRKWIRQIHQNKTEESKGMTNHQKLEHRKWVRQIYRN